MTVAAPPTSRLLTAADHGKKMSLEEFQNSETAEGYKFELAQGVVEVSEVPNLWHSDIQETIRDAIVHYKKAKPGVVRKLATDSGSQLIIQPKNAQRHPDVSLYLSDPPPGENPWRDWSPQIVMEIVSESSRRRDYVDKMQDYWQAGAIEYWIIDPANEQVQRCVRGDDAWTINVLRREQTLTTPLLPEFTLTLADVFANPR